MWLSFGSWHLGHSEIDGPEIFQFANLECFLALEVLDLGVAIVFDLQK